MPEEHPAARTSRAASTIPLAAALTAELLSGAERSFLAGNLVMAGWLCEEIRQADPDDPASLHLLGLIAERERRLTDASTLWRQALAANPHFTPAWLSLATLHRTTGNREAAVLCYRCLLAVDPADRDGWYNLGNVLFDIDLSSFGIPANGFMPYVGGGAGYVWTELKNARIGAGPGALRVDDTDGNLAYQAILGAAWGLGGAVPGLAITSEVRYFGTVNPTLNIDRNPGPASAGVPPMFTT